MSGRSREPCRRARPTSAVVSATSPRPPTVANRWPFTSTRSRAVAVPLAIRRAAAERVRREPQASRKIIPASDRHDTKTHAKAVHGVEHAIHRAVTTGDDDGSPVRGCRARLFRKHRRPRRTSAPAARRAWRGCRGSSGQRSSTRPPPAEGFTSSVTRSGTHVPGRIIAPARSPTASMPIVPVNDAHDSRIAEYRNVPDGVLLRDLGLFVAEGRLVVRQLLAASRVRRAVPAR